MNRCALRVRRTVGCIVLLSILSFVNPALAQEGGSDKPSEISLFVGSLLPNQIDGVTEILPLFGGRYGLSMWGVMTEATVFNSHAEGVDFTRFSYSARADLPAIDQFVGLIYGGLDFNYYRPVTASERQTETGLHVGAGIMMHASDTLWLRSDLCFSASPGTSLSLLFGLVFRPGGGAAN